LGKSAPNGGHNKVFLIQKEKENKENKHVDPIFSIMYNE